MIESKKMQLSSLITGKTSQTQSMTKESRRALFEAAEKADADWENAKQVADSMLQARSQIVEQILNTCGKGPFTYKGEKVIIVKRKARDSDRVTFFFRSMSHPDSEII